MTRAYMFVEPHLQTLCERPVALLVAGQPLRRLDVIAQSVLGDNTARASARAAQNVWTCISAYVQVIVGRYPVCSDDRPRPVLFLPLRCCSTWQKHSADPRPSHSTPRCWRASPGSWTLSAQVPYSPPITPVAPGAIPSARTRLCCQPLSGHLPNLSSASCGCSSCWPQTRHKGILKQSCVCLHMQHAQCRGELVSLTHMLGLKR